MAKVIANMLLSTTFFLLSVCMVKILPSIDSSHRYGPLDKVIYQFIYNIKPSYIFALEYHTEVVNR